MVCAEAQVPYAALQEHAIIHAAVLLPRNISEEDIWERSAMLDCSVVPGLVLNSLSTPHLLIVLKDRTELSA